MNPSTLFPRVPCTKCPTCEAKKLLAIYLSEELGAPMVEAALATASVDEALIHSVPLPYYQKIVEDVASKFRQVIIESITPKPGAPFKFPKKFDEWVKAKTK